jgi:hypothetical protein
MYYMQENNIFNVLIVIDLQKQFKDDKGQYEKCIGYVKDHYNDSFVLGTVFKNSDGSMYEKHRGWSECKDVNYELSGKSYDIEYPHHLLMQKNGYGIDKEGNFTMALDAIGRAAEEKFMYAYDRPEIRYQLIGCDADACILASGFYLWDKGMEFEILSDYIYSNAEDVDMTQTLKIMRHNFGDCVK